jgi:hypothetical protein
MYSFESNVTMPSTMPHGLARRPVLMSSLRTTSVGLVMCAWRRFSMKDNRGAAM